MIGIAVEVVASGLILLAVEIVVVTVVRLVVTAVKVVLSIVVMVMAAVGRKRRRRSEVIGAPLSSVSLHRIFQERGNYYSSPRTSFDFDLYYYYR